MFAHSVARILPWTMKPTQRGGRRRVATLAMALVAVSALGSAKTCECGPTLSGCWRGCWVSFCSGHTGKLRGSICQCDATHFRATFTGTFWKIIPFKYTVVLTGEPAGDHMHISGQSNLGRLAGGTYYYTGWVTDCHFHLEYRTKKDRGKFEMDRE